MKPVKNVTETVCSVCAPELFSKYCIFYYDRDVWRLTHLPHHCVAHKKILRRVEPPIPCHTPLDGSARWQFTLEDYDEAC